MTATSTAATSTRGYLPHLGVMLAVQSLNSVCAASIPVLAPAIAPQAGIAATNIGVYTMVLYGCGMFSAMLGGALTPRFGAVRVCQVALLCCASGLAMAMSGHVAGLALCAFVLGSGMGAPSPASSHLLARVTPPRRFSLVFSIKQTGVPLGGAIAGATLPALTLLWGWQGALLATIVLAVFVVAGLQLVRADMDDDRRATGRISLPEVWSTIGLIWSSSDLRLIGVAAAILSAGQVVVTAFFVTYLVQSVGLSLTTAGFALATALIGGVVGRVLWGAVADWSRRPLLVLAGLTMAAAVGMLLASQLSLAQPIAAIHAVGILLGATTIGWAGVIYAEVARRAPPGRAAAASGGVTSVMFAGIVIGPAIFGAIVRWSGGYMPAFAAMATALVGLFIALVARIFRGGER